MSIRLLSFIFAAMISYEINEFDEKIFGFKKTKLEILFICLDTFF
jgi:hypothetical protein